VPAASANLVAGLKILDLDYAGQGSPFLGEGSNVNPRGAVFSPDLIQLMKVVLEDATAELPEAKRTSAIKAEMACSILAAAGKGERNPDVLRMLAVGSLVDCSHYSHDISPERRVV
jgi:hypothetical protein